MSTNGTNGHQPGTNGRDPLRADEWLEARHAATSDRTSPFARGRSTNGTPPPPPPVVEDHDPTSLPIFAGAWTSEQELPGRGGERDPPPGSLCFTGFHLDKSLREIHRLLAQREDLRRAHAGFQHQPRDILERLRGHAAEDIHTRAVDILVSRLRRKLEPLQCIKTLRNAGYTFAAVRA